MTEAGPELGTCGSELGPHFLCYMSKGAFLEVCVCIVSHEFLRACMFLPVHRTRKCCWWRLGVEGTVQAVLQGPAVTTLTCWLPCSGPFHPLLEWPPSLERWTLGSLKALRALCWVTPGSSYVSSSSTWAQGPSGCAWTEAGNSSTWTLDPGERCC